MKLIIEYTPPKSNVKIDVGDKITMLGSCFSDEIAIHLRNSGFEVLSNPFGTIFHPTALANLITCTNFENSILKRDDLYFSWVSAGTIYDSNPEALEKKLKKLQETLIEFIRKSKFLFVTFGTAYAYENESYGSVVANCHKIPSTNFIKVLSSVNEMFIDWNLALEKIFSLNPTIQVVFTVSPVRHIRDGVVENNHSKARLIELTNQLTTMTAACYFPSYELLIDILRDYRFYTEDLVHPNHQAIEFIYNQLENTYMQPETIQLTEEVRQLKKLQNHKILYPESLKSIEFEKYKNEKVTNFLKNNPKVYW